MKISYEQIRRAAEGNELDVQEILEIYDNYINKLIKTEIIYQRIRSNDREEIKSQLQLKLIQAIKKWREQI